MIVVVLGKVGGGHDGTMLQLHTVEACEVRATIDSLRCFLFLSAITCVHSPQGSAARLLFEKQE